MITTGTPSAACWWTKTLNSRSIVVKKKEVKKYY